MLGAGGLLADAEVLLLLFDCLNCLGLKNYHLVLGEAGLAQSLLSIFPEPLGDSVRQAIANLDRITLEQLPLSAELQELAFFLFDLRGTPREVLTQVAQLNLDEPQQAALNNLKSLIDLLEQHWAGPVIQAGTPGSPCQIVLDLSLIQSFDYYTGLVFSVVSENGAGARVLAQGGRYDQLLGLYHPQGKSEPGIGFVLNVEDVHQALLRDNQLPTSTPASDWLVVATSPPAYGAALAHAEYLRTTNPDLRVELDLGDRQSPTAIQQYGHSQGISRIAWVDSDGTVRIEDLKP